MVPEASQASLDNLPLVVDLDGTLVRSDTLVESVLALGPSVALMRASLALARDGKAAFKQLVASTAALDVEHLPYHAGLLGYLRQQKARGRRLILATAADAAVAQAVADHLGLFDQVLASDGRRNLRGGEKAAALVQALGERGFVYAGNDSHDLPVWREAAGALVVNAPPSIAAKAAAQTVVVASFPPEVAPLRAVLKVIRTYQWVKNLLVFVPVITAHAVLDLRSWLMALLAFIGFSTAASAIYVINDMTDLAADRRHIRKRARPFAAGTLDARLGLVVILLLLALAAVVGHLAGILGLLALYAALSLGYSLALKQQPLVDVFVLAALYTLRLFGGGQATGHPVSIWLLGFSSFLFLSLALVKRVAELTELRKYGERATRRGYAAEDAQLLTIFGCGAAFAAALVLALFVQADSTLRHYDSPIVLWGFVPLVLFWSCRIWLSTARGYMHDDPIIYAARDWVSWCVGVAMLGIMLVAAIA